MREFAFDEIHTYKCRVCGCKLKTSTDLIFDDEIVGYSLHCCNCGKTMVFTNSNEAQELFLDNKLKPGIVHCHKPSYCPHKDCPLYGTDPPPKPDDKPDSKYDESECYRLHGKITTKLYIPGRKYV